VAALPEAAAMEVAVVDTVEATEDSKEVSYFNHFLSFVSANKRLRRLWRRRWRRSW